MKKKLLSLLIAVCIFVSMGYKMADASTLQADYNMTYGSNHYNGGTLKGTFGISLSGNEEMRKELLAALQVYMDVENNWNSIKVERDMDLYRGSGKAVGKPGDILIAVVDLDNISMDKIMEGTLTSHAAMVDLDPSKVLEVMPGGVQNLANDWRTRYKKILVLRPKTDETTIRGAIAYGHFKLNTPLAFDFMNKTRTDHFYCSQFVWRCYYNNGLDLDANGGHAVFPYDFISDKVSIVYKQG
jgi:uncharacterized protein YycO